MTGNMCSLYCSFTYCSLTSNFEDIMNFANNFNLGEAKQNFESNLIFKLF